MAKKKCKTCIYRAAEAELGNCDYILITGHMRGCPAGDDCIRYEKGERIGLKKHVNTENYFSNTPRDF